MVTIDDNGLTNESEKKNDLLSNNSNKFVNKHV